MRLITVQSPMFKLNSTKPMHKYNKISVTITINMNSLFVLFFHCWCFMLCGIRNGAVLVQNTSQMHPLYLDY